MSDKRNTETDEIAGLVVFGLIGLIAAVLVIPISLIALPLMLILRSLLNEEDYLMRYSFGLVVGAVSYFFLFGVNFIEFDGILFRSFGDQVHLLFNLVMDYWPKDFRFIPVYPEHVRIYFWISYGVAIILSLFFKFKDSREKKTQKSYFERSYSNSFNRLLQGINIFSFPFVFVTRGVLSIANRYFTSRIRAQIFIVTGVTTFYLTLYLIFGSITGWFPIFGFVLNKGNFIFSVVPLELVDFIKHYFYFAGALFPMTLWHYRHSYGLKIKADAPLVTRKSEKFNNGSVYLGKDSNNKDIFLTPEMLNHHVHVVGASGFGKTTFLLNIIKAKIDCGEGLIFVDLKGDIDTVCEVTTFVKNAGRLDDFEFFSISEDYLEVSKGLNLFKNGNALEIKDKIMGAFKYDHDYYKKRIESFLTLSLRALVFLRDNKGEAFDLESIYKLILGFEHIEELALKIDSREIKSDLESLITDKRLKEDLTGLRADIEGLIKTDFAHLILGSDGINFYESMRNSKIVFIHLDSQRYEVSAEKLGRLILQDIKTASAKIVTTMAKHERAPFTLIVDEFANLATEQFVGFLNRARASGIGIVIAHQELSDLEAFSAVVKDQIMTNTSTLFSFLQKLPESAEIISGIGGTFKTEKETMQIEDDGWLFGKKETGMGSLREVEEYIIHPNLIKNLTRGECFMVSKYPYSQIAKVFVQFIDMYSIDKYELVEILKQRSGLQKRELLSYEGEEEVVKDQDEDWL